MVTHSMNVKGKSAMKKVLLVVLSLIISANALAQDDAESLEAIRSNDTNAVGNEDAADFYKFGFGTPVRQSTQVISPQPIAPYYMVPQSTNAWNH